MATAKSTLPPRERSVNSAPADEEPERLAMLVNTLIDAEADVDDARCGEEAARLRLEDAIALRNDLQHLVEAMLARSSPWTAAGRTTENV